MKNSKETIQMPQMILDCILDPLPPAKMFYRGTTRTIGGIQTVSAGGTAVFFRVTLLILIPLVMYDKVLDFKKYKFSK